MAYGMDAQSVSRPCTEPHAEVADAKAHLAGPPLELLDIAFASLGEALERSADAHRSLAVEAADVRADLFRPSDLLHA